nr:ZinT/AdcA family metal-binding protein [Lactococcus lactis]
MDGTFLNSNNDYDRKAFLELFKKLKAKEVRFVVASGNQYAQISSFFPEIWEEITFVSENGGLVFEKGNLLIKKTIAKPIIQDTLTLLENTSYKVGIILCGVQSAYILKSENTVLKKEAAKYYFALKEIDSFQDLPDDEWVKIALQLEDKNAFSIIDLMNEKNNSQLKAVYSGNWQSVYPLLEKGALDQVFELKSKINKEMSAADYKDYYTKGYKTDVDQILIDDKTMSFIKNGVKESYTYQYKGFKILNYSKGNRGVRYLFESSDPKAGEFKYVQFSDHNISPVKTSHFHIFHGGESQEKVLAELENWPTYYPKKLTGFEIAQEMIAH